MTNKQRLVKGFRKADALRIKRQRAEKEQLRELVKGYEVVDCFGDK